ncbi:MAG TPA: hypothetical protein DCL04_00840, partial [Synergistaceae bacterium]|nr:hypothetical protein [Synergistaceae bacterium]
FLLLKNLTLRQSRGSSLFKFNKGSQEMAQDHFHQSRTCPSWTGSGMDSSIVGLEEEVNGMVV